MAIGHRHRRVSCCCGCECSMASRFLRADWHRACRLSRPQRSAGGNTLFLEAGSGNPLSSAPGTNSGGLASASRGRYSTSGKHLLGRSCSTLAAHSGGSAYALGRLASSNSNSGRFGSVNSAVTAGLQCDHSSCCWRGGLCSSQGHQQAGRRFLSNRRGKASGQT